MHASLRRVRIISDLTMPNFPANEKDLLEVLSDARCWELLPTKPVGRVAFSMNALPAVLPVNYRVHDGDVQFFTGTGAKLRAAFDRAVVAFEVDDYDPAAETGWDVLVIGIARAVTDADQIQDALEAGLRPWAGGHRGHLVSVRAQLISGRQIPPHAIGDGSIT